LLDGQFTGLAIDGPHRGCRFTLTYAMKLDADPARGQASGEGKADGVWTCMCSPEAKLQSPQPVALPGGCVFPFAAEGSGSLVEQGAVDGLCQSGPTRRSKTTGAAELTSVDQSEALTAAYVTGTFRLQPLALVNSNGAGSPGFYGGTFEMIGANGGRIEGRIEGPFGVDSHRDDATPTDRDPHLEGALSGVVTSGPLEGCTLLGVASARFSQPDEFLTGPLDWSLRGSIVCDCAKRTEASSPTKPMSTQPSLVLSPILPEVAPTSIVELNEVPLQLRGIVGSRQLGRTQTIDIKTSVDLRRTFREIDSNGNASLDTAEFYKWAEPIQRRLTLSLDIDKDGQVADEELEQLPYGARLFADLDKNEELDRLEIEAWMQEGLRRQYLGLDADNSGAVSFREFKERSAGFSYAPKIGQ